MTNDEAARLAHKWFEDNAVDYDGAKLVSLVNFEREIENAAYERVARWCEREDIERDPDDLYSGRAHRAAAIRALIQPPAQKENGE